MGIASLSTRRPWNPAHRYAAWEKASASPGRERLTIARKSLKESTPSSSPTGPSGTGIGGALADSGHEQDAEYSGPLPRELKVAVAVRAKLLDRIPVGAYSGVEGSLLLLAAGLHHGARQLVLGGEVDIERGGADAGASGDGMNGHLVLIAELEQQLPCGLHQCGAQLVALPARAALSGVRGRHAQSAVPGPIAPLTGLYDPRRSAPTFGGPVVPAPAVGRCERLT